MSRPVRHWPGGIPSTIQPHPNGDLTLDEIKEEVKGWLLFVQENWVPRSSRDDEEYELRQRRALVEQWASASQDYRDSFHTRAPIGLPGTDEEPSCAEPAEGLRYPAAALERIYQTSQGCSLDSIISLAPITATYPHNRAYWVKFAILLYRYDLEVGHCLADGYQPSVAQFNPSTLTTGSLADFMVFLYLEVADFRTIYLTRSGTDLYLGYQGPYLLVDEEGLLTGRLTVVDFRDNGSVGETLCIRPFNIQQPYNLITTLGKGINEVSSRDGAHRHQDQPIDMDLPILDILCRAKEANQLPSGMAMCDREQWEEDLELYAPGYLTLEAQGRGGEYDLSELTEPDMLEGPKRIWQRLEAGENPHFRAMPARVQPTD